MAGGHPRPDRPRESGARPGDLQPHVRAVPRDLREGRCAQRLSAVRHRRRHLFARAVAGTDPSTAVNFERMVMTAEGPRPFGLAAFGVVTKVMNAYFAEH